MYNRYVPQPDGSYQKNRVTGTQRPQPQQRPPEPPPPPPAVCPEPPKGPPISQCNHGVGDFIRSLLPRGLDTGDLLVILLLLLMAADSEDGQNQALLTLALYLFL